MGTTPILFVVGASAVGKTTAVRALEARGIPKLRCFYFDSMGLPSEEVMKRDYGGGEQWQLAATHQWVERLVAELSPDEVGVLDGQTRPSFIRQALAEFPEARARIVLFNCETTTRNERTIGRGTPNQVSPRMDMWSAYLCGQHECSSDQCGCASREIRQCRWKRSVAIVISDYPCGSPRQYREASRKEAYRRYEPASEGAGYGAGREHEQADAEPKRERTETGRGALRLLQS
jgi:hypothetical protein